ncbi:hypothetical protein TDIS_0993 [Thermosulfurimonas dismutans]|uniref:Uncharacterized protein n=1 Tax=Thermosulfurimonas dismutans TaxID=999894 RepID=A0A179D486_9BACT|nr:hypothetical protein TDIS_0993 [Thermosulfurimonas dismutans]
MGMVILMPTMPRNMSFVSMFGAIVTALMIVPKVMLTVTVVVLVSVGVRFMG